MPSPKYIECPDCAGRGELEVDPKDRETGVYDTRPCRKCEGEGIILAPEEESYWPVEEYSGPDYLDYAKMRSDG